MRTLRAELLKLRTTRTSRAFLLAAVCLVAAGVAQQAGVAGKAGAPPLSDPGLQAALLGAGRLTAVLGTAAVLALTLAVLRHPLRAAGRSTEAADRLRASISLQAVGGASPRSRQPLCTA